MTMEPIEHSRGRVTRHTTGAMLCCAWLASGCIEPAATVRDAGEPGPSCFETRVCATGTCAADDTCHRHECDEPGRPCVDGSVCAERACDLVCGPPAGLGEICLIFSDDNPCRTNVPCGFGLVCDVVAPSEYGSSVCVIGFPL